MPPKPLILAFDTSAAHCAVALLSGHDVLDLQIEEMSRGQAERLFPLIEEMFLRTSKSWNDIDGIGVGIGPGNFTGIRVAVSAARGLALSLGVPSIGVTTLEALALGCELPVLTLIDARRDQVYGQIFNQTTNHDAQIYDMAKLKSEMPGKIDICIGHNAVAVAAELDISSAEPVFPLPVAIGRLAFSRLADDLPRPAPMYLKSADAAPSRDAPPVILS